MRSTWYQCCWGSVLCQMLALDEVRWNCQVKFKISSTTYAGRPTDMISTPLTVGVWCTMTLAVCTGVLWGTPEIPNLVKIPINQYISNPKPPSFTAVIIHIPQSLNLVPICATAKTKSIKFKSWYEILLPLGVTYQSISALVMTITITFALIIIIVEP